jgi:hypothetical protein
MGFQFAELRGESLLLDLISGDKPEMPKDDKPLSSSEVAAIRKWIETGATWPAMGSILPPGSQQSSRSPLSPESPKIHS